MLMKDVTSDKEHIYVLYDDDPSEEKGMSILVFDWDGMPVARWHIGRAVAFAINTDDHIVLTINENERDGICSVYKITENACR